MILHCLPKATWEAARDQRLYRARALATDGYTHCSGVSAFPRVLPNFAGATEPLTLLALDPAKLTAPIRWGPDPDSGVRYPHIYGPLDTGAVVAAVPVPPAVIAKEPL